MRSIFPATPFHISAMLKPKSGRNRTEVPKPLEVAELGAMLAQVPEIADNLPDIAESGWPFPILMFFSLKCSFFIVHSSFFILHSSFFILHCSLFIVHCSFFILHSSFFILHF